LIDLNRLTRPTAIGGDSIILLADASTPLPGKIDTLQWGGQA
jgi:hypothetical protein